jgi:leucyl-tRNA synthetase
MAVPAHDERDFAFAEKFSLPIVEVIEKPQDETEQCYHGEGVLMNSGIFNGMQSSEAREEIVAWLEQEARGRATTTYKIRDWSVSRQRYWGAPIPMVHCAEHGAVLVPDDQLPIILPELEDFAPSGDGRSALARATDWLNTT